jgi:hypothetical protein
MKVIVTLLVGFAAFILAQNEEEYIPSIYGLVCCL